MTTYNLSIQSEPGCGARRMAGSAALLVEDILHEAPVRQWVLSFPYALRFLFATRPAVMGEVLRIHDYLPISCPIHNLGSPLNPAVSPGNLDGYGRIRDLVSAL